MATKKSRAERNNNPGNVRPLRSGAWLGQVGIDNASGGPFAIFQDASKGYRAMAIDVYGDIVRDGKNTIAKVIAEYAPASENKTEAYIKRVSEMMGVRRDFPLNVYLHGPSLLHAMATVEIGKDADKAFGKDARIAGSNLAIKYLGL